MNASFNRIVRACRAATVVVGTALLPLPASRIQRPQRNRRRSPVRRRSVGRPFSGTPIAVGPFSTSGRLELVVETKSGVNARSLRDLRSGRALADRDYAWFGGGFPKLEKAPAMANREDGSCSVSFRGRLGPIEVEQTFTAPGHEPDVILERITIRNSTDRPLNTADFQVRLCQASSSR